MKKGKILIIATGMLVVAIAGFLFGTNMQSKDDLIKKAEQAFLTEDYIEALKIYKDDSLEDNPVALNNLGYLLSMGLGAEKDIKSGRDYYKESAELGNPVALDNYVRSVLKHPITYDEVLDALIWGHTEKCTVIDEFIENMIMDPEIVERYGNTTQSDFWHLSYHEILDRLKKIKREDGVILKDELSENEKGDFIGELCYRDKQVLIGYRTETQSDGNYVGKPVYGTTQELGYRTYCLDYTDISSNREQFQFRDNTSPIE